MIISVGGDRLSVDATIAVTGPGITAVLKERVRQIEREGFDLSHDLGHHPGELAAASVSYLNTAIDQLHGKRPPVAEHPDTWPWLPAEWRDAGDARANLVKGLAIGLAVLDRIDHAPRDSGDI